MAGATTLAGIARGIGPDGNPLDPAHCRGLRGPAGVRRREARPCPAGRGRGALAGIAPLGVKLCSLAELPDRLDAMIDFSHPSATLELARLCRERSIPLVVGTTGFDPPARHVLEGGGRGNSTAHFA